MDGWFQLMPHWSDSSCHTPLFTISCLHLSLSNKRKKKKIPPKILFTTKKKETGLSGKRINCHIKTQQFLQLMKIDPEDFYRTATIIKLKDFIKENKKKRVQLEMVENRKMLFTYLFTGSLSEPKRANERK